MTVPPSPLSGIRVVCLALYVPALVAAQRLRALGASVTIVEPPAGDPFAAMCPPWYQALRVGQATIALDLKTPAGLTALAERLTGADLLLTALRPAALDRLGLGWDALRARHPALCHVAIVGYPAPDDNVPGHDLTYQASMGLLEPPGLPRTLIADLAGAERAAQAALAVLLGRARGHGSARTDVALAQAVEAFADPVRFGLTTAGSLLGGGLPGYGIYAARDGWVAVAALEPHFWSRLLEALELSEAEADRAALERVFASRSSAEWEAWAAARGLPIASVRTAPA